MYLKMLPREVSLPEMIKVRQKFDNPTVENVRKKIREEFEKIRINEKIKQGNKIAITAGSRGIKKIGKILSYIVDEVKMAGGEPFILSAMGSH